MRLFRTTALVLSGLTVVGGLAAGEIAHAATASARTDVTASSSPRPTAHLLDGLGSTRWFSPNGDKVQDALQTQFRVGARARVTIAVRRAGDGKTVRRIALGVLDEGYHRWSWKGRNDRHRIVKDGDYRLVVRAARGHRDRRHDRAATPVGVRTTYTASEDAVTFEMPRDTVYPSTEGLTDTIYISAFNSREVIELRRWYVNRDHGSQSELRLRDAAGHVVRSWTASSTGFQTFDGTADDGSPLPAGAYTLLVTNRDNYGNPKVDEHAVFVSAARLVAQPWSTTISADDALVNRTVDPGCSPRDCVPICPPKVPSPRVAGGVTVLSPGAAQVEYGRRCDIARGNFSVALPFALDAADRVTITATGSAVPSDGPGSAVLTAAIDAQGVHVWPGTSQTTLGPAPRGSAVLVSSPSRLTWSVDGWPLGATEYDVASFDVEVVHYVPQG